MSKTVLKASVPLSVLAIMWLIPVPSGLTIDGWHYLAIFMAVVTGLIFEPVPSALVGFTGVALAALLQLTGDPKQSISWALSGFSNTVIWLIFAAFMFALGYQKTGLGKRISLLMIRYMGKSSLGLGYAVAFSDLLLAPFMPSNTARSAGTIYPVAVNIPLVFNSTPDHNPGKLGSYLMWVGISSTCVTSSMFLTALAPNLLAVEFIASGTGHLVSWSEWARIMVPLMIPAFLLTPWLVYVIYPPKQKYSPEAPEWAAKELRTMGRITKKEIMMASLAGIALILWIFGDQAGIHATTVAVSVVAVMVLLNVITWEDVISKKDAFNILIWFAFLVAMASGLEKTGILKWIGDAAQSALMDMPSVYVVISMLLLFFVLHYFFASTTAHTTALMPLFVAVSMNVLDAGQVIPVLILLAGSLGVMGIITPYATGPSPIWYGAGYISQGRWWGMGALFGALYLVFILAGSFLFL